MCIKSDGENPVDIEKVKDLVASNGIQVSKASLNNRNGDMYIDCPTNENREKVIDLINEETLPGNKVVKVNQKCPTISIRGVNKYQSEEEFI